MDAEELRVVPEEVAPHLEVCGTCRFSRGRGPQLACGRFPPVAVAAPLAVPGSHLAGVKTVPQINWIVNAFAPPVQPTREACGEYRRKPHLEN
jgi:hypothetical protein